jgi:hypothetical protein
MQGGVMTSDERSALTRKIDEHSLAEAAHFNETHNGEAIRESRSQHLELKKYVGDLFRGTQKLSK